MNPSTDAVLERTAALIREHAVPILGADYAAGQLQRGAVLLQAAIHELENGCAWRVDEIGALHALLVGAAPRVDDPALAETLREVTARPLAESIADLRLSALQTELDRLRAALAPLHAWAERTPAAADVEEAIWGALRDGTDRRRLAIGHY